MLGDNSEAFTNKQEATGYSYLQKHLMIFTWEINNIRLMLKSARNTEADVSRDSPSFSMGRRHQFLWKLQFKVNKDHSSSKDKTWLSVYLVPLCTYNIQTKYAMFLLNNKKEKIFKNFEAYNQSSDQWTYAFIKDTNNIYGDQHFVKIDDLLTKADEFLVNDTLTIGIELIVYDYKYSDESNRPLEGPEHKLCEDLKNLLVSKKKSDVIIKVGDHTFNAHKIILMARSNFFEAMFSHNMKENNENEVNIPDIDPELFKKILEFIYTDKVDDLEDYAVELLDAAGKYQLRGLKELCEVSLSRSISYYNAIKIMILAERYNMKRLKERAIEYVAKNSARYKTEKDFRALEESYPEFFLAVIRKHFDNCS